LATIELARHPLPPADPAAILLHIFSDTSEVAYGTAAYLRTVTAAGTIVSRLLCAKSRVAPLAKQTLPRLELCAAVLGAEHEGPRTTDYNQSRPESNQNR